MKKFKNLIVLGPLIYAIHHFEEHIIFNFIEWKLQYFQHSAAALSTEAILSILTCILVLFALLHLVKNNKASAQVVMFIFFAIQVVNAFYHISELKKLGASEDKIKTAVLIAADIMKMSTLFYGNEFDLEAFKKMLKGE